MFTKWCWRASDVRLAVVKAETTRVPAEINVLDARPDMDGGSEGGGRCGGGGGREELIEAVLTCEGNIHDPELPKKLTILVHALKYVTHSDSTWFVRKVEPWNSVRVTFSIPREAAIRLHQLAQAGDQALRQLGILSVQVEGDQVISLKVAGPNNESTEIVLRTEGGASDGAGPSSVARSVTTALGGASLMPGPAQAAERVHGPPFRSPNVVAPPGEAIPHAPRPLAQMKPPYPYTTMNRAAHGTAHSTIQGREVQVQQPAVPPPPVGHSVVPPTPRPLYNPPPPYPNMEQTQLRPPGPPVQRPPLPQVNGTQYAVGAPSGIGNITQPSTQVISSVVQTSSNQTVSGSYQVPVTQTVNSRAVHAPTAKGAQRTGGNMLKSSPLLVDLLRQPDQPGVGVSKSRVVVSGSPHGSPAPASPSSRSTTSTPSSDSLPHTPLPNLPLPAVPALSPPPISSAAYSAAATTPSLPAPPLPTPYTTGFSVRAKDGVHTHQQVYSGGSVITSTVTPHPRLPSTVGGGLQQHPQATGQPPPGPRPPLAVEHAEQRSHPPNPVALPRGQVITPVRPTQPGEPRARPASPPQHVTGGKESQYLINPNTGLLEPRPSESSDSEPEARPPSPVKEAVVPTALLASDEESNISVTSKKETDQSDSEASRMSVLSIDSKKTPVVTQERPKSHDRDSSPASSRESSLISSGTTGESIKIKLTIGKESVAQATFVPRPKKVDRKEVLANSSMGSHSNTSEPRVPKLHIKLQKSKQAVIVNRVGDGDSRRSQDREASKEEKNKRRSNRNKPRSSESDSDSGRSRSLKQKSNKEKGSEDSPPILKIIEGKKGRGELDDEDLPFKGKVKESLENRVKGSRTLDDGRLSIQKPECPKNPKTDKFRPRIKGKTPIRKVGDLHSVGEIASHKILETLPPSITKVAELHTQQPHINPSSSSSQSSLLSSAAGATVQSASGPSTNQATGDLFKTNYEKRIQSEVMRKPDLKSELDHKSDGNFVSRLRTNSLANLMNGDLTHGEKVLGRMRAKTQGGGGQQQQADGPSSSKLTIKMKGSGETHTLESFKKDLPEGYVGNIPKYLNSSVMINKVSHSPEKLPSHRHEDPAEKGLKKLELKHSVCTDLASLKANSDITIHSVTKNETLSFNKSNDGDGRNPSSKSKSEITRVGRVTHLDVNDRKALQEALKSSQSSTRNKDTQPSNMQVLLRRFNSIDSSTTVPVSSQSESTNSTSGVKVEPKVSETPDKVKQEMKSDDKSESKEPHITSVSSSNSCDTSVKVEPEQTKILEQAKVPDFPGNVVLTKSEVESPDGTPKGEHGSGQGGEDSGIESMDALSEKSPNQSDQSPTRRDEKDCEPYSDKNSSDKTIPKSEPPSGCGSSREQNAAGTGSEEVAATAKVKIKSEPPEDQPDKVLQAVPEKESNSTVLGSKTCESQSSDDPKVIVKQESDPIDKESSQEHSLVKSEKPEDISDNSISPSEDMAISLVDIKCEPACLEDIAVEADELEATVSPLLLPPTSFPVSPMSSSIFSVPDLLPNLSGTLPGSPSSSPTTTSVSHDKLSTTTSSSVMVSNSSASVVDASPVFATISVTSSITSVTSTHTTTVTSILALTASSSSPPSVIVTNASVPGSSSCSAASTSQNSSCPPDVHRLVLPNSEPLTTSIVTSEPSFTSTNNHTPVGNTSVGLSVPHSPKTTSATTIISPPITKQSLLAITLTRPQTSGAHSQHSQVLSLPTLDKLPTLSTSDLSSGMPASSSSSSQPTTSTTSTATSSASAKVVTLKPSTSQGQVSTPLNLPPGTTFRLVALPGNSAMAPTTSAVKVVVSPVKGQLSQQVTAGIGGMTVVTMKPVVMATGGAKNSQLLQTLPVNKSSEDSSPPSLLKAHLTAPTLTTSAQAVATSVTNAAATPIVSSTLANGDDAEDLDFVGFSSSPQVKLLQPGSRPEIIEGRLVDSCKSPEVLSPTGEEPTPMRVHPPLYTYGNRERRKDVESDAEDKDREETKNLECEGGTDVKASGTMEADKDKEDSVVGVKPKTKDKKFDALSIEIPPADPNISDDKRLTRSTRQSARLASPKVNSPGADLSPKVERRSPASMLSMGKPSPVPVLRPSVSPATRGTKRRRHESESSNASSVNEDTQELATKSSRRKPPDKVADEEESSEDESLEGGGSKKRNPSAASTSTNEDDDDSRPSSRSSRTSCKTATRSRERQSSAESTGTTRDTTPTRRNPRHNNRVTNKERSPEPLRERLPAGQPSKPLPSRDNKDKGIRETGKELNKEKEVEKKELVKEKDVQLKDRRTPAIVKENKNLPKDKSPQSKDKDKSPVQGTKTRKDSDQSEPDASTRRKTRSTATANEDTPNKRRRLSKDK